MPEVDEAKERKVVYGIDEEFADQIASAIDEMPADIDDLPEGGMADIECTIVGLGYEPGGEERESRDGSGEKFISGDSLVLHLRVDDWEEQGLENDHTVQFLRLPKMTPRGRAKPTKNSGYGLWLTAWDAMGISSNPEVASTFQIANIKDLIGIKYHRIRQEFELGNGQRFGVFIPDMILGVDDKVRKDNGLSKATLKNTG